MNKLTNLIKINKNKSNPTSKSQFLSIFLNFPFQFLLFRLNCLAFRAIFKFLIAGRDRAVLDKFVKSFCQIQWFLSHFCELSEHILHHLTAGLVGGPHFLNEADRGVEHFFIGPPGDVTGRIMKIQVIFT